MLGAGIHIVPFMIQRNVPGIGPHVLPAFLFAAFPALLAALCYAILASAMPRAGGSYVYASRALHPYLGFVASFSQWFGLSIAIGVISYLIIPFLRDVAAAVGWSGIAAALEMGAVRVVLAILLLWTFVLVNLRGLRLYTGTLIPMMFLMFVLGAIVIVAGFSFDHADFAAALAAEGRELTQAEAVPFRFGVFMAAASILFSSFIGFDAIAQAGGEARNPSVLLPLAIGVAILTVGGFYLLFTSATYHAVPWWYVAEQALERDVTAPGLLGTLLSPGWTVAIVAGAAVALINDLPAMLLSVSRLMFAWAGDGVFPRGVARIHQKTRTPHVAIVLSGLMATLGIIGSHLAGDFFLGVDILVTSMLVNFGLMCLSVLALPTRNPKLAQRVTAVRSRTAQIVVGSLGAVFLLVFLAVHIHKDLSSSVEAWYFHSTPVWLIVMAVASLIYLRERRALLRKGVDVDAIFAKLPPE